MTREEYLKQSREKQMMILQLKRELTEMRKSYINEHKQIEEVLPVKIHYIHTEKDLYVEEGDAYITSFKVMDYTYYESFSNYGTDGFLPDHGIVYPVLTKAKKDGGQSKFEFHYPKYGTLKFWVIGKEDKIYELDFGR